MPSVRWISVSTHGAQFNQTPLALGKALARARESQPQAWILTSATLTAAGRFDHYLAEVGIERASTARWNSPFDFPRQALLYLPQSMPSPYDVRFAEKRRGHWSAPTAVEHSFYARRCARSTKWQNVCDS